MRAMRAGRMIGGAIRSSAGIEPSECWHRRSVSASWNVRRSLRMRTSGHPFVFSSLPHTRGSRKIQTTPYLVVKRAR